jgi:hypothetical protein
VADDAREQRRALGVLDDAAPAPDAVGVPRSALPAIRLAAAGWSQWRWLPGMVPAPLGLDRAVLVALAPIVGVTLGELVLRDVGHIEAGAIEAMTEGGR